MHCAGCARDQRRMCQGPRTLLFLLRLCSCSHKAFEIGKYVVKKCKIEKGSKSEKSIRLIICFNFFPYLRFEVWLYKET